MVGAGTYGNKLKEMGIAVDVVNFCVKGVKAGDWKGREWMRGLDKFVEAVNNNNNSCIKHIKANSLTRPCHILSSDPEIISRDLLEEAEREINKDLKGKNHVESVFKIPQVLKFDDVYDHYSLELDNRCKALSSPDNNDKKKVKLGKRKMVARNSYVASRRRTKACLMILSKKHRFWYRSIT
ncbi:uncharacterized protein [Rutidosis leptorrhynchoides]|uniref:uncharacterized protein n=1 Tax=Rutidosis leptorrhynchoides TaxID=125765 RepID=UPI003A9A2EBC